MRNLFSRAAAFGQPALIFVNHWLHTNLYISIFPATSSGVGYHCLLRSLATRWGSARISDLCVRRPGHHHATPGKLVSQIMARALGGRQSLIKRWGSVLVLCINATTMALSASAAFLELRCADDLSTQSGV